MRDIYGAIELRLKQGRSFVVATLVQTSGGSPAPLGASLIVDPDGSFAGNIGAGCHEAELIERAMEWAPGAAPSLETYRLEDEVLDGSVCGASLHVILWEPDRHFAEIAASIREGLETVTFDLLDYRICIPARRRLVLVGATHLAARLSELARTLDFHVTLVDPRPRFATRTRHPYADRIVIGWPDLVLSDLLDERSSLVTLAHDLKIDVPALYVALRSDAAYVGALGSRRAQRVRAERLRELGITEELLSRLHGPAGLDLGGDLYEHAALSILSDLVASAHAASGAPLVSLDGPIHRTFATTRNP